MQSALRSPALIAGAVVAAGVLATVPTTPSPTTARPETQLTSGFGDLFTPYADLFTQTFDNVKTLGADWLSDPVPFLSQVFTNQAGYGDAIWTALFGGDLHGFFGALDDAARGMTQNFLNVIHTVTSTVVSLDTSQLLPDDLQLPPTGDIVSAVLNGNFHDIIQDIIGQIGTADLHVGMPLALLIDALGAPYFGTTALTSGFTDFFDELFSGHLSAAFTTAFTAPATITDAFLNGSGIPLEQLLDALGLGDALENLPPIDLGSEPVDVPVLGSGTAHLGEITIAGVHGTLPIGGLLDPLSHPELGATVQYSGGEVVFEPTCLPIIGCLPPAPPIDIDSDPDVFDVSRELGGTPFGGLLPALVNWVPQQLADAISAPVTSSWSEIDTEFLQLPRYLWDQFQLTSIFGD